MKNLEIFNQKNNEIYKIFINAKINNNIPHACILHVNFEYEQKFIDAILNHIINIIICENNQNKNIPCQKCENCINFIQNQYNEIFELSTNLNNKILIGKNKNDINTMRWFQSNFHLSLAKNKKRIGIIKNADRLNVESQNAFLKTLESPLQNNFFLLSTKHYNKLLETIRSRCIKINVYNLNIQKYNDKLIELIWNNINEIKNNQNTKYTNKILLIYNEMELMISKIQTINDDKKIQQKQQQNKIINMFIINSYILLSKTYIATQDNNQYKKENKNYENILIEYEKYLNALNTLYNNINNINIMNRELILLKFAIQICS